MLQTPNLDTFDPAFTYPAQVYVSSSEPDSVRKIQLIIAGHPRVFAALRDFLCRAPTRRSVTFIKGNHDVNLHWRGVQAIIRLALEAYGARAPLLRFAERKVSREGIYVEHGNQYAAVVDRMDDFEEPRDPKHPDQLKLPIGSYFVIHAFNQVEWSRYWIDGVKPITALIWYALTFDTAWAMQAIRILATSLPDVLHDLLLAAPEPPEEARPIAPSGIQELLDDLDDPAVVHRYTADASFQAGFQARLAQVLGDLVPSAEQGFLATPSDTAPRDPIARGRAMQQQVNSALFEAAALKAKQEGVDLVVFGHTHDPVTKSLPEGGTYLNSGTWTWSADFRSADRATWRELFDHPERFTDQRRLTYVRVDYDAANRPIGHLMTYEMHERPDTGPLPVWQRLLAWLRRVWAAASQAGP
jgi:hypothetical protein